MRARTVLAVSLLFASLCLAPSTIADTSHDERVALTMTAENELKIYVHGVYSSALRPALRSALDGDANPLMDAGGVTCQANRTTYSNELKKLCSGVKCNDGLVAKDDANAFSGLAETSKAIYGLLVISGVINATATLNDGEAVSSELISFSLSTAEGSVKAILPVESDYIVNLKYSSTQSPSVVSFHFKGKQGERNVPFSFTAIAGWDVSAKGGLLSQSIRTDYPSAGFVTLEGVMESPNLPAKVATSPRQVDLVCWSIMGIVIAVSLIAMYVAWRRMKKQRIKEERMRKKAEGKGTGSQVAEMEGVERDRARLKELREKGIVTEEEYGRKIAELDAKN